MKLVILTNIITPYTKARLNELGKNKNFSITLLLQASKEPNRKWNYARNIIQGIKCILLPGIHLNIKDSVSFHFNRKVGHFIKQEKPDLLIIVGWNNLSSFIAAHYCKKHKIPIIAWSGSTKNEAHILRKIASPAIRWLHKQCAAFFAYGTAAKSLLINHWGISENKIHVLGNPVDNNFFIKESKKETKNKTLKIKIDKKKQIILFIGQLIPRKGVWELIEAFKKTKIIYPQAALVFAGTGPLEKKIKAKIKKEKLIDIYLAGYYSYAELPAVYKESTIFCLPSNQEVWGLVVNEAMACNKPVVVSDACGCVPDLMKHKQTGLLFQKGNANELSSQLNYLLANKKRRDKIASNGHAHIKKWDIKKLEKIFFKVIKDTINP